MTKLLDRIRYAVPNGMPVALASPAAGGMVRSGPGVGAAIGVEPPKRRWHRAANRGFAAA
jgi:hypothetical protein